jgi:hypothetical protein
MPVGAGGFAAAFAKQGHALCRGAVPAETCQQLRTQSLQLLDDASTLTYHYTRFGLPFASLLGGSTLTRIRNPFRRHVVTLPPSQALRTANAQLAVVARAAGLPWSAQLVEQSAMIVLPGARAQDSHTDISPSVACVDGSAPLITLWLALQDVTCGMGPTTVYPKSHTRYRQRAILQEKRAAARAEDAFLSTTYDADGSPNRAAGNLVSQQAEGSVAAVAAMAAELDEWERADMEREAAAFGADVPQPLDVLLRRGDCGVMDCRIRHFGSGYGFASGGGPARVLLNATFAAAGVRGGGAALKGFTYHRHDEREDAPMLSLRQLLAADTAP